MKRIQFLTLIISAAAFTAGTAMTASAAPINDSYSTLNEKAIYEGGESNLEDQEFTITNNTSETWTDFHFGLEFYEIDPDFVAINEIAFSDFFDGAAYEGAGTYSIGQPDQNTLDVVGLSVAPSSDYAFSLDVLRGEGNLGFNIRAYPTIDGDGNTVPVPGALYLMALGLIAVNLVAWRKAA